MTTLNARANQAYREMLTAEDLADGTAAFDSIPDAFEEGWETGYKAKQSDMSRDALEDAVREALEDLGIIGYPTRARNDAEEPLDIECVVGHIAGYVAAIVRQEVSS